MARGRMVSKSLSTSQRFAALHDEIPRLAEFAQVLYMLLITHSDDYGRQAGDVFTVKHAVLPTSPRRIPAVESALSALHRVGLIAWYEADGRKWIQVVGADEHQGGLHKRTQSMVPAPPSTEGVLNASERDVEEMIASDLLSGALTLFANGKRFVVEDVKRQVRRGASYIDIVAYTDGPPLSLKSSASASPRTPSGKCSPMPTCCRVMWLACPLWSGMDSQTT